MSAPFSCFAQTILDLKYSHTKSDGTKETWEEIVDRVVDNVVGPIFPKLVPDIKNIIEQRKMLPAGRYLYASGRRNHQISNCLALDVNDSREGWAELLSNATNALMTGAGIGVNYSKLRANGELVRGTGGQSTGPLALMQITNEAGRHIRQGGSRRSAIWAGLNWAHPDIFDLIKIKNWKPEIRDLKAKDFNFPATLDMTNVSVLLDDEFFAAYHDKTHTKHELAQKVYWKVVRRMCKTGEPGLSVDTGKNADYVLRNACSELCSADDSDLCNLGSINMSAITSQVEMREVTGLATIFLLCGSIYSTVPYPKVAVVREKNRRIGLGLLGVHDWLLSHGYKYGENKELTGLLEIYQSVSVATATEYANKLNINRPKGVRAVAPAGTISIIAETSSGIEPIFCTAFKRRYLKGSDWHVQYVVDAAAQRLIDKGVRPDDIEDAMVLAAEPERRLAFQAFVQKYVDHCISSTINLPEWGSPTNNEDTLKGFGDTLMVYLPQLRGVTAYPAAGRGGEPLTRVSYEEAISKVGVEFLENGNTEACPGGVCGV